MNTDTKQKKKWYKTWWGVLVIILFFPIFLTRLIWRQPWNVGIRVITIALLWVIVLIAGTQQSDTKQTSVTTIQSTTTNSNNAVQTNVVPTNTPKPAENFNIVVTSEIVKKVNGKYRYFFDIRNKDSKPFEGSVTIDLYNSQDNSPLAGDTFNTNKAIEPDLGTSVYTDAHTGPPSVHGDYGLSKFKYTVKKGDEIVKTGEGTISDQFEDTDSYGF